MQGISPYNQQPNYPQTQYQVYAVEEKFSLLRSIASVFRGLAVLTVILTGIAIVLTLVSGGTSVYGYPSSYFLTSRIISIGVTIIAGLVTAIYFEAISQGIKLFISIEHNQRIQSEYMRQLAE